MIKEVKTDWRSALLGLFPERQIYVRSSGEVKCITLSTRRQMAGAGAIAFLVVFSLLCLLALIWTQGLFRDADPDARMREARQQRTIEDLRAREAALQDLLEEERVTFQTATLEFEQKHETLAQLLSASGSDGSGAFERGMLPKTLEPGAGEIVMGALVRDAVAREPRRLAASSPTARTRTVGSEFQRLDATQNLYLANAEAETLDRIERDRAILGVTDLDVNAVLASGPMGQGGPLNDILALDTSGDGAFGSRMGAISARMVEAEALAAALESMPLGNPIAEPEHRRTSGYGVRKDPFTGRPTFHEGLDFGARRMADIAATAPGRVIYAGRNGGYGNVIEIDHGHGFVTRYAHLEKTFVKRGDAVEQGDIIAGMGSTGRSTATHLHYEVHFQGRAFNPAKFLKAGRYVQ